MNVSIKHNGTTITSKVISYSREHRICTSVGTLEIVLEGTYSTAINPWDTFDIYENGSFKVKYYVSSSTRSVPDGTITVECQDKSKRLVDYFIPKAYTIDYPSYTRYWIQKFLTEAGISYNFLTTSQGNLLSNNTSLGLQSGYDQIMMLLQLSGWYMYFTGGGVATIGSLDEDLATTHGSLGKTSIIDIKKITNDDMLRNRAVVWGQYDVLRQEYAYADVSTHTRWNYDHRDLRTMVVSNSNIPNKNSAYGIANKLIKEFAKATIEKHITATGARNFNLGNMIRVNANIWRGKGMITTFGVSMDRNGLVTNLILDERCPRLFGFFNFGDYVYVGTFGDGIWRKHVKFDRAWYDFSSGLLDLNITDLHINNAIFGSVSDNGNLYYTNDETGPWYKITLTGLDSSVDNTVPSGGSITYGPYSGIMGRATIIDKATNNVKFGVDTWSGLNTGDYFLSYSGFTTTTQSGSLIASGCRGWIVEYDPYTGQLVGGMGLGVYPISYSGNYEVIVLDLENDGVNDYVSVALASGDALSSDGSNYNYGYHYTQPFASTKDANEYSVTPHVPSYVNSVSESILDVVSVFNNHSLIATDNTINGYRKVMALGRDGKARVITYIKEWDEILGKYTLREEMITSALSCPSISYPTAEVLAIYPMWEAQKFRIYYRYPSSDALYFNNTYYYQEWDSYHDTWDTSVIVATQNLTKPAPFSGFSTFSSSWTKSIVVDNKLYLLKYGVFTPGTTGGYYRHPSGLLVYIDIIDLRNNAFSEKRLVELITEVGTTGTYGFFPASYSYGMGENGGSFARLQFAIFQNGIDGVKILGFVEDFEIYDDPNPVTHLKEYVFVGNEQLLQYDKIYDDSSVRFTNWGSMTSSQLTLDGGFIAQGGRTIAYDGYIYDGTSFIVVAGTPYYIKSERIFPILNHSNKYIAEDDSEYFNLINADSISPLGTITPPTDFDLMLPFSTSVHAFMDEIYFLCYNNIEGNAELVPYNPGNSFDTSKGIYPNAIQAINTSDMLRGIDFGDMFIIEPDFIHRTVAYVAYIDMGIPEYGGGSYVLLRRDGLNYSLIRQAAKPIRIDISNNSPIVSVLDDEDTFQSDFIYGNNGTSVLPTSGLVTRDVRDFRYTLLETVSGVMASGVSSEKQILYANPSGIYIGNAETYSGGFYLFDTIFSGLAERIETSNYVYPGQFVFVTTSGENPIFYQRDNDAFYFDEYSGLPSSRATIIRLDDRF